MNSDLSVAAEQFGLIIREREPVNLEFPFDHLDSFFTPNDLFYIRSHFKCPHLDRVDHELSVEGAVERPFKISFDELFALPSITRDATMECAGNGRIFLVPQVKGAQWQLGAVSTAKWTGVPLSALLERAGLKQDTREIVFEGADRGTPKEEPVPPGSTRYARSIEMGKSGDVLIAYAMNGEILPMDHGFPLRAIVPGHYGMASVKWLTHIRAVTEPFQGYFQTSDYGYWADQDGNPVRRPLGQMPLKSAIARPRTREPIAAGATYKVFGAAWGGDALISQVDVSTDDGETWSAAQFVDEAQPFLWRRWEFDWKVPLASGVYILKSRATDRNRNVQPEKHDERFGSYVIHHLLPIEVVVR
jgi:DMSO/TMAO reductase YedYZ molybdopterin-dependent catalytic subunit